MLASGEGVYMFSTNANLTLITEAPSLYMDGTFQSCPRLFYRVFTIHAFKHGEQFPLVYFLLQLDKMEHVLILLDENGISGNGYKSRQQ